MKKRNTADIKISVDDTEVEEAIKKVERLRAITDDFAETVEVLEEMGRKMRLLGAALTENIGE